MKTRLHGALRRTQLWLLLLAVVCFTIPASAQGQFPLPPAKGANLTPQQRKIDGLVRSTMAQLRAQGVLRSNAAALNAAQRFSTRLIKVDNRARLHLYLQLTDVDAGRLAALSPSNETQIELVNPALKMVQSWVPYDEVEALANLNFVLRIRPPDYARPRTGSVTSQGDAILKANLVRSTLGITGAGVKVGVLSDGANNASTAQGTGDLPMPITSFGTCDPNVTGTTCNEGTAMMEIVYDLAPGAILAMGAVTTNLDMIQRVTDLKNWGARVIVDDLGFYGDPYFADGTIAQSYANALAQGIVMISAAGNDGLSHYQGLFSNSGGFHDFGGGDTTMAFTVPALSSAVVVLQWSNQFGASADDYDLFLMNSTGTSVVASSEDAQTGSQNPIEAAVVNCTSSSSCTFNVKILLFAGTTQTLELFFLGGSPTEYNVPADTIFGHAAVPGVIAAGAIRASDPGNVNIEPYSSRGPSTISFPSPQQRATPTLATIDCVSDTGAGGFPTTFCGTSAAAPHAAAVAALLLQARPIATPAQVANFMQSTAADRGTAGFDNIFGSGLVDALAAVNSAIAGSAPFVTINQAATQADPTNASPINFTVVFSEAVTGFATGDVTLSGTAAATTATVSGSGTTYNVAVTGMAQSGTVIATIAANVATGNTSGLGNQASTSTDNTVTFDNAAPTFSAVTATSITGGRATITWTTNEASDSQVDYGLTTNYGSQTPLDPAFVTSHSVPLSGLTASTLYHYRVKSKDAAGNLATSGDLTFTTAVVPAPTISSFTPAIGLAGTTVRITGTNFTEATAVTFNGLPAAFRIVPDPALSSELLTNGNFESGNFTGWTATNRAGGVGSFVVGSGTVTPQSGLATVGAHGGTFYALTDNGAGTHALTQSFTLPGPASAVSLAFSMFVNDWDSGPIVNPVGLDHTDGANQHARVDLLTAAATPFDTTTGILRNFYQNVDPLHTSPNPYRNYVFDIANQVGNGGTFQLRFAEVDNQYYLNLGVDDVSILFQPFSSPATIIEAVVPAGDATGPIAVTTPGGTATSTTNFTVGLPYMVGDVAPLLTDMNSDGDRDDAGEFGDGILNNLDLIQALRAVVNLSRPPSCSDRFDAMDSITLDTTDARGGDGTLNNQDLIRTLRRVVNLDTSRPTRVSRGISPCPPPAPARAPL